MANDLVSLVLTLKALPSQTLIQREGQRWWGRASQALFLRVVREQDEALSMELHDSEPPPDSELPKTIRPYTVSSLRGYFMQGQAVPGRVYTLRLTAFRADVANILLRAMEPGGSLFPGTMLELDYLPFVIEKAQIGPPFDEAEPDWASLTGYEQLSAPFLLAKQPAPRRISLQLSSPTTFKSGQRHVPFPAAELVFGSLLTRWNAYAPVIFPLETRRYAAECLALSRYELKTIAIPQKSGGLKVGAVGYITFVTLNYDRYWMSVLAALASFSMFSGVGAGTAQGLGQCRMLPEAFSPQAE